MRFCTQLKVALSPIVLPAVLFAATPQQADEHTLALWTMDNVDAKNVVIKDQSNHGKDLKVAGVGELQFVDGLFGKAVDGFDPQSNKDNRYLMPPAYKLKNPSAQTFEAWICWPTNRDLPTHVRQTLWRNSGSRAPFHFYFQKDKDGDLEMTLAMRDAKKYKDATVEYATYYFEELPKAGQWYHVAYTLNQVEKKLEVKFYFSNQTQTNISPEPVAEIVIENFKYDTGLFVHRLGEEGQTGSDPFKGMIDDVRISNIARTTFDTLAQ